MNKRKKALEKAKGGKKKEYAPGDDRNPEQRSAFRRSAERVFKSTGQRL